MKACGRNIWIKGSMVKGQFYDKMISGRLPFIYCLHRHDQVTFEFAESFSIMSSLMITNNVTIVWQGFSYSVANKSLVTMAKTMVHVPKTEIACNDCNQF